MNLDSYTRLNPYSEDEKENKLEAQRDHTVVLALAMIVALGVIFVLVWSRS